MRFQENAMEELDPVATSADKGDDNVYVVKKDYFLTPVNKKKEFLKSAVFVFLSAFIYSAAFHYFVSSCNFAPGGVGGVVAIVKKLMGVADSEKSGIDYSSLLFILVNIPMLAMAWKSLGRDFCVKTLITSVLITVFMFLLDNVIDPDYTKFSISGKANETDIGLRLISAMIGGATTGVSLACALKVNSSTGGADIIGALIQKKYPHKSIATMICGVNAVIMAVSVPVYKENLLPVFLSLVFIFVTTIVCDKMLLSSKSALKFEVVTEYAEDISKEIIAKLGHGVTVTPAVGMFEHHDKQLLICVISPRQVSKFQSIIRKYPDTFAYVGSVSEVIGKFNDDKKK